MSAIHKSSIFFNNKHSFRIHSRYKTTGTKPNKSDWKSVVGLEVHAQIQSQSKLFSGASTDFSSPVNSCVSLFDAAIPGTLPVLNKRCVEAGVLTALALDCKVNRLSMFDRKHYFYADLPAGYQITQQRAPLASGGLLEFHVSGPGIKKRYIKKARMVQLQLEQDSGRILHDEYENKSLVDLNRAGIPLMELVFCPDLSDGEEAACLVKELILILQRLGTCNCKMEEGALRVDANVSLHRVGTPLGTRTEIKNIGSVRGVANAIAHEIHRQREILDGGGTIRNETRAWDSTNKVTVAMREKEDRHDYRFMPEPNLPPLVLKYQADSSRLAEADDDLVDVLQLEKSIPELPTQTRSKLICEYNLTPDMAVTIVGEDKLLNYFTSIMTNSINGREAHVVAKILVNELLAILNKNKIEISDSPITAEQLCELLNLLDSETINKNTVRNVLQKLIEDNKQTPTKIVQSHDWVQIADVKILTNICQETIAANENLVKLYKSGKKKVFLAMLGDVAKRTNNRAKMSEVAKIMEDLLK